VSDHHLFTGHPNTGIIQTLEKLTTYRFSNITAICFSRPLCLNRPLALDYQTGNQMAKDGSVLFKYQSGFQAMARIRNIQV
jgi:hypothetical protein